MSLHNLKDAGGLVPSWVTAAFLNILFLGAYIAAYLWYGDRPIGMVSATTTITIVLALFVAAWVLIGEIVRAETGEVASAASRGLVAALNISWTVTAIAVLVFIGWEPASALLQDHLTEFTVFVVSCVLVTTGYLIAKPANKKKAFDQGLPAGQAITLPQGFIPTPIQRPTFQASMADLSRLMIRQAAHAVGYTGSNVLFDDTFSLELDVNARVARVYSNTHLISTEHFMYWRLHMLLMGPAAELVLTGSSSEAAIDDYTNFDELCGRYLAVQQDRTYNAAPSNDFEAAIKASRISFQRKAIFDRCVAVCRANQAVLTDLVKLMRTRSVLCYGDIRTYLDRVEMPEGFPQASVDEGEVLNQGLLAYEEHDEVFFDGDLNKSIAAQQDAEDAQERERSTGHPHMVGAMSA